MEKRHDDIPNGAPTTDRWLCGEPRLEDLLADPMVALLARRWHTTVDEIRQIAGRVDQSFH
jgi:hypothetical protein